VLTGGEGERVEMTLPRHFGHQIKGQKMKNRKYVEAYAANKQTKIHNNQQKQSRQWGRGINSLTMMVADLRPLFFDLRKKIIFPPIFVPSAGQG